MILGLEQSRSAGHIRESSVSVVAIQHVLAVVGDKQIHKAIVVVVANAYALPPARAHKIGFCSHVRECAVTIVFVEVIYRLLILWETAESPAIDNEYVEPSVIVIVEKGDSATSSRDKKVLALVARNNCFRG